MSDDVRLSLDTSAIEDLGFDGDAERLADEAGTAVADRAADLAPKRTGAGAASIHAETGVDEQSAYADVSWDDQHFYMGFAELGTERESPRPFLRPALDSTQI